MKTPAAFHVSGRGVSVSAALTRRVQAKVEKVSRLLRTVTEARIVLARERHRHLADVTLAVKGGTLRAEAAADDFYAAVDLALATIKRQVRRRKDRIRDRKPRPTRPRRAMTSVVPAGEPGGQEAPDGEPLAVRRISAKPMSLEEALEQFRIGTDSLLVFTNAESRSVNVIHRRSDGSLELVEPGD